MRYIYQSEVQDGRGNFVAGASVTVTRAGGTTKASIYSALTGGTVDADGIITTGTDGTFAFYVDEDDYSHSQQFRIVWSKSGFTSETWDYIQIFPDGDRTLLSGSTVDQGDAAIVGTLAWHKADISTDSATITVLAGTHDLTTAVTLGSTINLKFENGGIIKPQAAVSLTVYSPEHILASPRQQIIDMTNNSTNPLLFSVGGEAFAEWLGASPAASAATNGLAFNAAYAAGGDVKIGSGNFSYDTTITIDRAMEFSGAGSCQDNGVAGVNTTTLTYTGTSHGIGLTGSGANGKENIHLRDFQLLGNALADGGLNIGTTGYVHKSSYKNIHIKGFSQAVSGKGYGVRLQKSLTSVFENVYTQSNYDGWVSDSGDSATTLRVLNSISRSNARYGVRFVGTVAQSDFFGMLCESNVDAGLYLYGSNVYGLNFYGYYGEANNTGSGNAPIILTGSGGDGDVRRINFDSPHLTEYGTTIWTPANPDTATVIRNFYLDYAADITIRNPDILFYKANNSAGALTSWMEVTANTTNISVTHTDPEIDNSWIAGYSSSISVNGVRYGTWTATMTASTSGTITLSAATCGFEKVGSRVTLHGKITVGSVSSPVGTLKIESLPYTVGKAVGAGADASSGVAIYADNLAATATTSIMAFAQAGATYIQIDRFTAGQIAAMAADVEATSFFTFSVTYHTEDDS